MKTLAGMDKWLDRGFLAGRSIYILYIYTYPYTRTQIYVYMCICIYVYTYRRIHVYISTCTYIHIRTCVHIYIYISTHTHTHTHPRARAHLGAMAGVLPGTFFIRIEIAAGLRGNRLRWLGQHAPIPVVATDVQTV